MIQSSHIQNKRGIYSVVSAFLFIIVLITLVIGVIYYETVIAATERGFKEDLNLYEVAKDTRNRIFYCYENIIDTAKLNNSCQMNQVKGFTLTIHNSSICSNFNKTIGTTNDFNQKFVYAVPIKEPTKKGTVCLGKLEAYI